MESTDAHHGTGTAQSTDHGHAEPHQEHHGHSGHGGHAGHGGHSGHQGHGDHVGRFRRLFWINLILAVPVVAFSSMFAMLVGYEIPDVPGVMWIAPVLGTVMYVWGGWPFLTGALDEIRAKSPGMMLLIGLAITVAFLASWGASIGLLDHQLEFWWEL
ncbi:MAG TPA: heavy metal translocating P-type ATPase, partial [Microbacterium sp.]|nr:heavy metal translocating P-type ATPase [Microbacterium sp.]